MAQFDPINYNITAANPVQNMTQGLAGGLQVREAVQKAQLIQEALARQKQMQADFQAYSKNPNASAAANLMLKYPDMSEKIKSSWDMEHGAQGEKKLEFITQAYHALDSGNNALAEKMFRQRADGYKNAGDKERAQMWETYADEAKNNPKGMKAMGGVLLSSVVGPDKFKSLVEATQKVPAEAGKIGAETIKTAAETKKILSEIGAGEGPLPPEKRFDFEHKLRQEYEDKTKDYRAVNESWRRIQNIEDNAAGDIALIFSYMKALDPSSVVREGEFATAQNAGSIPDKIKNMYNKALSGERLQPGQRSMFVGQSKKLFEAAAKRESEVRKGMETAIKNYRLNPDNVFYSAENKPTAPAAPIDIRQRSWMKYAK